MDNKNLLQTIGKYAVPAVFAVLAIVLIYKGTQTDYFEEAICNGEQVENTGEANIVEGNYKELLITQTDNFKIAGFILLAMAIGMVLFVANVINRITAFILLFLLLPIAGYTVYKSWEVVDEMNIYQKRKKKIYTETKQRLKDIKEGMIEYKNRYNRYPHSLDGLIGFIKDGKAIQVIKEGDVDDRRVTRNEAFALWADTSWFSKDDDFIAWANENWDGRKVASWAPDEDIDAVIQKWSDTTSVAWGDSSLTEQTALYLGLIVRDTVRIPVIEKLYLGPTAKKRVSDFPFDADSLKYMAYTDEQLVYAIDSVRVDDTDSTYHFKHRFQVSLLNPFKENFTDNDCEMKDDLIMGSLTSDKISGNWK